jgi:hypothetical protein
MKVMRALINQLNLAQSINSPFPNMLSMVARYSTSPWSNTPPSVPMSNAATTKVAKKSCCEKIDPMSPDKMAKATANQRQKKPCCSVANKSTKCNISNMGMFYLHRPDMKATDIFPKDILKKVCIDFTCKDRVCTKENCSFAHPRNTTKFQKGNVNAICRNFIAKKIGWLNKGHFMIMSNPNK